MSEYQYVTFRAVDRPVSDGNLSYMHGQSSRARITPWTFENEYDFGEFGGDAVEILRRGYDIHLHFADFGTRRLMIRLPRGLPDPRSLTMFIGLHGLEFLKDKRGNGGSLLIEPFHESGDLENDFDVDDLFDRLVPLRRELLEGDLRPLYLAHLAVATDGNHNPKKTREAPVPAGLEELSDAQCALAEFYGLGDDFLAAAAQASPSLPKSRSRTDDHGRWLRDQPDKLRNAWLAAWMDDPNSPVRTEIVAKYRSDRPEPAWPVAPSSRRSGLQTGRLVSGAGGWPTWRLIRPQQSAKPRDLSASRRRKPMRRSAVCSANSARRCPESRGEICGEAGAEAQGRPSQAAISLERTAASRLYVVAHKVGRSGTAVRTARRNLSICPVGFHRWQLWASSDWTFGTWYSSHPWD